MNYLRNRVPVAVLAGIFFLLCTPFSASLTLAEENKPQSQPATTDTQRTQETSASAVNQPSGVAKVVVEIPRTQWCQCVRAILGAEGGDIAGCVKSGASEEKLKIFKQAGKGSENSTTTSALLTFAGCSEKENENVGSLSFDVQWKDRPAGSLQSQAVAPAQSREQRLAPITCEAGGISAVQVTLYRYSKAKLASVSPWDCSHPVGTLNNISTGQGVRFVITGKNASGAVLYRGELDEIKITYGQRTALGTITALPFTPVLIAPENAALLGSGHVRFAWTGASGATSYHIQVSDNPDFSTPAIDTGTGTASYETGADLASNTYYWRVKATDAFSNTSTWSSPGSVTVDADPPINTTADTFINKGAAATNASAVSLVISAVKKTGVTGITGYFISEGSKKPEAGTTGWVAVPSTASYEAEVPFTLSKGDGNKKISVWFKDALGHVSQVKSGSILLDTKLPQTTITSHPPSLTNSTTAHFTYATTKARSTFQCQLDDGAYSACTGTKSYEGLREGQHTFSVKATDTAGNTDLTPASFTWTIDLTPPHTTITQQPPVRTYEASARFGFTSTKPGSTFQCKLDGSAYAACVSPKDYFRLGTGPHTFAVKATDVVGNIEPAPASYTWTIATLCMATITDYPSDPSNSKNAVFRFTSNRPAATFVCKLDNGVYSACTSPLDYAELTEDSHTFSVKAIDAAENEESEPAQYTWVVYIADISKALDEMPVPDSPLLTMLGVTQEIVPPARSRRLVLSIMEGVDINGNLESAIAADISPYLWWTQELSLQRYQNNKLDQDLARIVLSAAFSKTSSNADKASRMGTSIRWSIWDDGDPRLDKALAACLEEIETNTVDTPSPLGTVLTTSSSDSPSEDRAKKCSRDSFRKNWNKSALDVGLALAWVNNKATGDSFRSDGIGFWTSLSYGFDQFERLKDDHQIIVHARYRTDQEVPGETQYFNDTDRGIFSLGAKYRWSDDPRTALFLQELMVEKKTGEQSRARSYLYSIGGEVRSGDNLWGEVELGVMTGYRRSLPGFIMVQIKMALPEGKTTK